MPPEDQPSQEALDILRAASPSSAEQAVDAAIASDSVEEVHKLASLLEAESIGLQNRLKARLSEHFNRKRRRLSMRDLERAIKGEKTRSNAQAPEGDAVDWQARLLRNSRGDPKPHLANAITALRFHPDWQGVLWRNEFAELTVARKPPPIDAPAGEWMPRHDVATTNWLQHLGIDVTCKIAGTAVEAVGYDRVFHPVRDYLTECKNKWDGEPRIDNWLKRYLGAKPPTEPPRVKGVTVAKPTSYLEAVGSKWLIAAVARVMRPGCKVDDSIILEGEQGIKKSTALEILGGEWFTDQLETLGSKDSSLQVNGVWIIEIGELGSMSRAERETIKNFMSRKRERYRPPYAERLVKVPRQCVFAGTVNPDTYLKDETGARRFWPVVCGVIDLEALREARDQLFGEAFVRFDEEATWWLDTEEVIQVALREQADRHVTDAWDENIARYIHFLEEVTIEEIFRECLKIEIGRRTQADKNRIGAVLRFRGWKQFRKGTGDREYIFRPYSVAAKLAGATQQPLETE